MVTRNLDVEDGVVNGCFGKIANIVTKTKDGIAIIQMLGLQLDNPNAGRKRSIRVQAEDNLVYFERSEENLRKGAVCRQFSIKLAYACTAHKVQGMSMQNAAVSLKIFEPGIDVPRSRTTSLRALHITDFSEKKIYADPAVTASLRTAVPGEVVNTKSSVLVASLKRGVHKTAWSVWKLYMFL
ncbi:hypothetical protein AMELA_G00198050 [Ameiurus melas]|uniref:ATP-dependent DNA helicase PIF1 n=1 Tax=Ameiurus melas TaxID=219545 RepID=A0A7J6A660_AMEME|nr:hypothetical protein AMELA_G00198050 [Ameiurus melas]